MVTYDDDMVLYQVYLLQQTTDWTDAKAIAGRVPPPHDPTDALARLVDAGYLDVQGSDQPTPVYRVSDAGVERLHETEYLPREDETPD